MKIKVLYVLIFLTNLLYSQTTWCDEYFYLDEFFREIYPWPGPEGALKWYNYLTLITNDDFTSGVPSYLPNAEERFDEAVVLWEEAVGTEEYLNFNQNQTDGVDIFWTNLSYWFTDPVDQAGWAQPCVAMDMYVNSCTENVAQIDDPVLGGPVTKARIVFNGTWQFGTGRLSSLPCDEVPINKVSITYLAMHELGHLLGLAHCDNDGSLMFPELYTGPACFMIQEDVDWLKALIGENPAILLSKDPVSRFKNRDHSFFEHEPEVLFYSQWKPINNANCEHDHPQTTSPYSEGKLYTRPKQETYKQEYLEGAKK